MSEKKQDFSVINSFKTIFSRKNLGEEAAEEHIRNNRKKGGTTGRQHTRHKNKSSIINIAIGVAVKIRRRSPELDKPLIKASHRGYTRGGKEISE